jgi:hypothetical protein
MVDGGALLSPGSHTPLLFFAGRSFSLFVSSSPPAFALHACQTLSATVVFSQLTATALPNCSSQPFNPSFPYHTSQCRRTLCIRHPNSSRNCYRLHLSLPSLNA